jgi:tRNA-dihydrouridine synthase
MAERAEAARDHYDTLIAAFGPKQGVRHARKHLAAYADHAATDGSGLPAPLRRRLVTTEDHAEAAHLLARAFEKPEEMAA